MVTGTVFVGHLSIEWSPLRRPSLEHTAGSTTGENICIELQMLRCWLSRAQQTRKHGQYMTTPHAMRLGSDVCGGICELNKIYSASAATVSFLKQMKAQYPFGSPQSANIAYHA